MKKATFFLLLIALTISMLNYAEAKDRQTLIEPFQKEVVIELSPNSSGEGGSWFTVPEDKLLIIETVSARFVFQKGEIPPGHYGAVILATTLDSQETEYVEHIFPLFSLGNDSARMASCHQVRIYAGPGTIVSRGFSKDSGELITAQLSISGQLVPIE